MVRQTLLATIKSSIFLLDLPWYFGTLQLAVDSNCVRRLGLALSIINHCISSTCKMITIRSTQLYD